MNITKGHRGEAGEIKRSKKQKRNETERGEGGGDMREYFASLSTKRKERFTVSR